MAVTYGFYNSLNHDRVYDAIQVSSIFDGIINDGVYMSIGNRFVVNQLSGMNVTVGTGRAWFNHTWTLNDAIIPLNVSAANLTLNRIDTVVLEVDSASRVNTIKVISGTPSGSPVPPTLIRNESVNQYPLADIRVNRGVNNITQANITNRVGTSACPFVTGIIQTINIDSLVAKWSAEWEEWSNKNDADYNEWFRDKQTELTTFITSLEGDVNTFITSKQSEFELWFDTVKDMLDTDVAGRLANRIAELESRWIVLGKYYEYRDSIEDSDDDPVKASDGTSIYGRVVYVVQD